MASLFVGNIAWRVTEQELGDAFANYGPVTSVKIIQDRDTGRSKGFGFVEFSDPNCLQSAIQAMDGQDIGGRPLRVNLASQRGGGGGGAPQGGQGGYGGGQQGGYGGGHGGY